MWSEEIERLNGLSENTKREIFHQPILWREIWEKVNEEKTEIKKFFNYLKPNLSSIVLTGAGTSAYVGLAVQSTYRKKFKVLAEPISTTHIVSHPNDHILRDSELFMISFARSGNSPESCEAVNLANKISSKAKHFIITCNKNGKLALENQDNDNTYVFVLPEKANDKSLAMTSSFTGMMLASILIARIDEINAMEYEVEKLIQYGNISLENSSNLWDIASKKFTRAIFLGSGPLYGIAKEAQLKMQELSDGLVICKHDSFLGLRHGPKAVINDETLVVYHLSNDCHASKYDMDLIKTMRSNSDPMGLLGIGENIDCEDYLDWCVNFTSNSEPLDKDLLSIASIVPAQLLSLFKSVQLGLAPDNPSRNGSISRVVQGVFIYQA